METDHIIDDVVDHQLPVTVNVAEDTGSGDDTRTDEEDPWMSVFVVNCDQL